MKIIKHGNLKPRKFVCWHCGCEFVAEVNEYSTITCSGAVLCHYADCPECGTEACHSDPWEDKDD